MTGLRTRVIQQHIKGAWWYLSQNPPTVRRAPFDPRLRLASPSSVTWKYLRQPLATAHITPHKHLSLPPCVHIHLHNISIILGHPTCAAEPYQSALWSLAACTFCWSRGKERGRDRQTESFQRERESSFMSTSCYTATQHTAARS